MNILVTGGTGYIGSHLIERLQLTPGITYCLYRDERKIVKRNTALGNVVYIKHDFLNPLDYASLPTKVNVVIHLAMDPGRDETRRLETYKVNTLSTLYLLEYGRNIGIDKFLFASSGSVYGFGDMPFTEEDKFVATDFYSLTKWQSELLVNNYSGCFEVIICRYFFPYGPGQKGKLIPNLIESVQNKRKIIIKNEGNPRINPIYIDDLVECTLRLLEQNESGTFNVAGSEVTSILELSKVIAEVLNIEPVYKFVKDDSAKDLIADTTRAQLKLRFKPKVGLKKGITETIKAYKLEAG